MFRITLVMFALLACSFGDFANADEDLDALLGELAFGESKLVSEADSLLLPNVPQPEELQPLPAKQPIRMPKSLDDKAVENHFPAPVSTGTQPSAQAIPQPEMQGTINFNPYLAAEGYGDECARGGAATACDSPAMCVPHQAPNLPPPSTFMQYFQSDNCNSNLWAGYEAERQKRCEHLHKHVHGTCDCFKQGQHQCNCGTQVQRTASTCDGSAHYH